MENHQTVINFIYILWSAGLFTVGPALIVPYSTRKSK